MCAYQNKYQFFIYPPNTHLTLLSYAHVKYSTQCAGDTNKLCLNLYTYGEKSVAILYLANTHIISITHMRKKQVRW
jgi:hypothetical protein